MSDLQIASFEIDRIGPPGNPGAPGAPGVGVPAGGTTNQILSKNSNTDFDTTWVTGTSGNPTGPAGGNLSGSYPNPAISSLPAIDGSALINLAFTQIGGQLADAQLPSDVLLTDPGFDAVPIFSEGTGLITLDLVGDSRSALECKPSCAVVAAAAVTLSGEQTIDGILTSSSLVLAVNQGSGGVGVDANANNGPWVTGAGAWTRPTWFRTGSTNQAPRFCTCFIRLGTTYSGSTWRMTTASVTIGTTAITWLQTPLTLNSSSVAGNLPIANLTSTGVSAGTYGDSTHVAQVAINAQGLITSASNVGISGGGGTNNPGGTADNQIQLSASGVTAFGASSDFSYNASTHVLVVGNGLASTIGPAAPAQGASTLAGANLTVAASNATAGSSNAGAQSGGALTIKSGDAAQKTSGGANGANLTLSSGAGIGGNAAGTVLLQTGGSTRMAVTGSLAAIGANSSTPLSDLNVNTASTSDPRGILSWQASGSSASNEARIYLRTTRGASPASPWTVITAGDTIGRLMFQAADSTTTVANSAAILVTNVGTVASTRVGSKMQFLTGTDAAPTVLTTALTLDQVQNAQFTGKITSYNNAAPTDGQILIGGTAAGNLTLGTITAGSGISVTNGNNTISIAATATGGTVTNTGGSLTANSVVLGAGTNDTKVVAGITTDGTSKVVLGVASTSAGSVDFKSATNTGTITLAAVTGTALGTNTLSLPVATDTLVGKSTTDTLANKTATGLALTAGSSSVAPLNFNSGTNLTSATAGTFEYDGVVHYSTHASSERGVSLSHQFQRLTSPYTLSSQQAAQQLFNATTNGQITVAANTTYRFRCSFTLSSMSGSSGSYGFALGGTASISSQSWTSVANKTSNFTGTAATVNVSFNTAANTALTASNTNTNGVSQIDGTFIVTTGGTVIPQVSLLVAAAAVVGAGSYFECWAIGTNTVTNVGNWS